MPKTSAFDRMMQGMQFAQNFQDSRARKKTAELEASAIERKLAQEAALDATEGPEVEALRAGYAGIGVKVAPGLSRRAMESTYGGVSDYQKEAYKHGLAKEIKKMELAAKAKGGLIRDPETGELVPAGGPKRLPPDKVLSVNEGNILPQMLGDLRTTIDKNSDTFGPVAGRLAGMNPYNERATTIDAQMRAQAQAFGRYMEGGVLRKEDEEKYRKMFPALSDTPEVARNKLALVEKLLAEKQNSNVSALDAQGYSTAGINRPVKPTALPTVLTAGAPGANGSLIPEALANGGGPKVGTVEDGHIYLGGDPRDPKSWRKVQ